MGILRCGQQLRLTGEDAEHYLKDTGRAQLPKTVAEYNRALSDAVQSWLDTDSPEGRLLAAVLSEKLINIEDHGNKTASLL